jgi:DNA-nicking Smr family endonuclease
MKDEDSMFRLLGDLSAFVKARRIALREELRPGPREGSREEPADERIFDEAMKDIRKIEAGKQRVGQVPQQKITIEEDSEEKKLAETLSDQYRFNVTNLPEYMEGYVEGTHPVTMEKLRSGEYSVQKVLDLHGLRVDEAYELFQEFIKDSTHANIRCVKVIHGRGLKAQGVDSEGYAPQVGGRLRKREYAGWRTRCDEYHPPSTAAETETPHHRVNTVASPRLAAEFHSQAFQFIPATIGLIQLPL